MQKKVLVILSMALILYLNFFTYIFASSIDNGFIQSSNAEEMELIEDGLYEIETKINDNMVLDVESANKESEANVQIYTRNNTKCQKVNIKYIKNGYYSLKFEHSGKYLDVKYASEENETNVWQYEGNGTDAQYWYIQKAETGYYNIISKCSGKYLTVKNGANSEGANVEINALLQDDSQKFKFNKIEQIKGTKTIEDGLYEIETKMDNMKVLDIESSKQNSMANVQIYTKNNTKSQKVNINYLGNGYYSLKFEHSGKYLDVKDANIANGNNVWQYEGNNTDAQKWVIQETEFGYYRIISKCSNTYLTLRNGQTANETKLEINTLLKNNSQEFKFNKVELIKGTKTIEDGLYEIETKINTEKVLDVDGAKVASGANVQIYTRNNTRCQRMNITYLNDGFYTIQFEHSGKYLDVKDANIANGNNVWQYEGNNTDAQKWVIREVENGYYNIISKCSETYLTVKDGRDANCANIEINAYNNKNSQMFKFNKITELRGIDVSKYQGNINWAKVKQDRD